MRVEIIIEKPVVKFLKKHNKISERFFKKMEIMAWNISSELLDIKKLKDTEDRFRLRIWKYRFLFRVEWKSIVVYFYDADSRWDIYKK